MPSSPYYSTIISSPLFASDANTDLAVGSECIDMRVHSGKLFNGAEARLKPYPTLGGLLIPYDENKNNTIAQNTVTALELFPAIRAFFDLGHTDCGAMKRLKAFLSREAMPGDVTGPFYRELMPRTDEFYSLVEEALLAAKRRGDDPKLVLRALTELMILKSARTFLKYPSDENGKTIADRVDAVDQTGQHGFDVIPAIYDMDRGRPLIYAFDQKRFVESDDGTVNWTETIKTAGKRSDAISAALREGKLERVERIKTGDYEIAGR